MVWKVFLRLNSTRDGIDPAHEVHRLDWDLREEGVQVAETGGLDQPLLVRTHRPPSHSIA